MTHALSLVMLAFICGLSVGMPVGVVIALLTEERRVK